jgi:hypothetical protein
MNKTAILFAGLSLAGITGIAQQNNPGSNHGNRFEELSYLLATPNEYRTATGAPGPRYWQQKADYDISVELDEPNNVLKGSETITYFNNSPNPLSYLWLQVDENYNNPNSDNNHNGTNHVENRMTDAQLTNLEPWKKLQGYGVNIMRGS